MSHAASLGIWLFAAWLLLSGHYTPLLLGFGVLSCAVVVYLSLRMDIVDEEGHPRHLPWDRWIRYAGWLAREIVLANLDVARRILSPRLDISPTVVRVRATQRTDLGRVMFANSITLTPGTVSMDVGADEILVHALSREGAAALAEGEMDARVSALEPPPAADVGDGLGGSPGAARHEGAVKES